MGGFLTLSPEFCFVIEDGNDLVGYAAAALNAKQFLQKLKIAWIPEMCQKYPDKLDDTDDRNIAPPQVVILHCTYYYKCPWEKKLFYLNVSDYRK